MIRMATQDDLTTIDAIYNQAIASGQKTADLEPWTPEQRSEWFSSHNACSHPIWVATFSVGVSPVVGYLSLSPYRCGRKALQHTLEVSLYVANEEQGKGIGSALLRHALDTCPALGVKNLFAIILDTNATSIALFTKHSFEQWGHLPRIADFGDAEVGHVYYGRRV